MMMEQDDKTPAKPVKTRFRVASVENGWLIQVDEGFRGHDCTPQSWVAGTVHELCIVVEMLAKNGTAWPAT